MIPFLNLKAKPAVLAGFSALAALAACTPPVNEDGIARGTVRQINSVFLDTAVTELALSPETATRLGMEEPRLGFTFNQRLDDRSQARFERTRLLRLELLSRLNALPAIPGDSGLARHVDIIRQEYQGLTQLEAYGFGRYGPGYARPYAVDQLSGAWTDVPELLISGQPLASHDDAEDYLDRLAALPGAIADEKRRLISDADNGIIPPRFVLALLEARLRDVARGLETAYKHVDQAFRESARKLLRKARVSYVAARDGSLDPEMPVRWRGAAAAEAKRSCESRIRPVH